MKFTKILLTIILVVSYIHAQEIKISDHLDFWARSMIETFHLVKNKAYYPIEFTDSIIKALDAFVQTDKYSKFLGPKDYNKLVRTTSGQFYGIGVILAPKKPDDDFLLVLDLKPNSPAYKKGLKPYDKIIAIDNKVVNEMNLDEILERIQGEKQFSKVKLNIIRNSELLTFDIERDIIKDEHINCYLFKQQKTLYCSLSLFTHQTANQLKAVIKKAKSISLNGIILDLRNNAGGVLNAAVDCASIFLQKGSSVVYTKNRNNIIQEKFITEQEPIFKQKTPIIILINNFTASAAEILAGILKLYSNKTDTSKSICNPYIYLLGINTHGKGSVQEVIPISNECALKLTTCLYCLPNNKTIENVGIEPDFYVEQKYPPTDEMKLIHKLYAKDTKEKTKKETQNNNILDWKQQKLQSLKNDYQIQAALNIISLLDISLAANRKLLETHTKTLNYIKQRYITESQINPTEL